jgi:hypothetical protein
MFLAISRIVLRIGLDQSVQYGTTLFAYFVHNEPEPGESISRIFSSKANLFPEEGLQDRNITAKFRLDHVCRANPQ